MNTAGMDWSGLQSREWLTVNGAGGFASGTLGGAATRRYHALLITSLAPGQDRQMVLGALDVTVAQSGWEVPLDAHLYSDGTIYPDGWKYLTHFEPWPVPTWTYTLPNGATLEKKVFLARGKNTVYVTFCVTGADVTLSVAPLIGWRSYHAHQRETGSFPSASGATADGWETRAAWNTPPLGMRLTGASWHRAAWWNRHLLHERERERGFDSQEDLFCPATATVPLHDGETLTFVATLEPDAPDAPAVVLNQIEAHQARCLSDANIPADDNRAWLVRAGDQFLVKTQDARTTVLAGYPWFTDWGRDTMIALPGLCLSTKRTSEAEQILRGFADHVSGGLIPNRFPDTGEMPEYNTADATLWWVHACDRYVQTTNDHAFQAALLPVLEQILNCHVHGTLFRIRMDSQDALLSCGEAGIQLTWMDAKVGSWVVTPRTGKPVEINALWVHALAIASRWHQAQGNVDAAQRWSGYASRARASFRERFTRPDGRGLYDVLPPTGPPDDAVRPNQLYAVALDPDLLTEKQAQGVVEIVAAELVTPFGLRTLSPRHPLYHGRYEGGPRERDGAYHQGTVWPYLLGIYADSCRRIYGPTWDATPLFAALDEAQNDFGMGGMAEVYDGDAPQRPNGCPWQAWSVGEALRILLASGPTAKREE